MFWPTRARSTPRRPIDLDAPDVVEIEGDETRLRQVPANLINNALVDTPAGTPVRVRVGVEGDHALPEVSDDGPGIPPGQLEQVFDRFHRAVARMHGGTSVWTASPAAARGPGPATARARTCRAAGGLTLSELPGASHRTINLP